MRVRRDVSQLRLRRSAGTENLEQWHVALGWSAHNPSTHSAARSLPDAVSVMDAGRSAPARIGGWVSPNRMALRRYAPNIPEESGWVSMLIDRSTVITAADMCVIRDSNPEPAE